jgi:PKD repeat protein
VGHNRNTVVSRPLLAQFAGSFVLSFFIILLAAGTLHAQEIYFSISGTNVPVTSGDDRHQYDYWLRPAQGVTAPRPATIEIFDAGLGGFADVIIGQPSTRTTFSLHIFESLYVLGNREILPSPDRPTPPLQSITTLDESRYLNRWVPFFPLQTTPETTGQNRNQNGNDQQNGQGAQQQHDNAQQHQDGAQQHDGAQQYDGNQQENQIDSGSPTRPTTPARHTEGYILRVATGDGNDVNDFQIRITGEGASDWELITLDLSVGLYLSGPENRFQFRPLWDDMPPPVFNLSGEEDSQVFLMDAFGDTRPVDQPQGFQPERYGERNTWAVVMTGSDMRVNNRLLSGAERIVPFRFDPVILRDPDPGTPTIRQQPTQSCTVYGLEGRFQGFSLDMERAVWSIDGRSYTGAGLQHEFPAFGNYSYTVLIPTRGRHVPRFVVRQGEVIVNSPPRAQIQGYRPIISPGEGITIDASASFDPEGRALEYRWFVNDEFRSSSPRFSFSNSVSGRYAIRLELYDNEADASCTQTIEHLPVVVNTQPYAEIRYDRVIALNSDATITAINDLDADRDRLQFTWTGDGVVGGEAPGPGDQPGEIFTIDRPGQHTGRTVIVRHETPGRYTITLTTDDLSGTANATYTSRATYKVNAAPVPMFTLPEFVAPGQDFALDATGSSDPDGDALRFIWNVSDGRQLSGATDVNQPSGLTDGRQLSGATNTISIAEPGLYTIRLTADDGEGVGNSVTHIERTIRVNAAPVPVIAAVAHTNNAIVGFDGSGSNDSDQQIVAWEWNFGDGNTARGPQVEHTFGAHGIYTITLTVDDGTGVPNSRQSVTHQVTINKNPVASATAPARVAPGQRFTLDGSGSNDPDGTTLTHTWLRNGREIGTGARFDYSIDEPGTHQLDLIVRDATPFEDAFGAASVTVRVNHSPVIAWQNAPRVPAPNQITVLSAAGSFDADGDDLEFIWEFSDGEILRGAEVWRAISQPGVYFFTLFADDGQGLTNSVSQVDGELRINQAPVLVTETRIRSNTTEVLLDASESYDPDGETLRFNWILPDGSTRSEATFLWTAPEPGIHAISLSVDDGEGLDNSVQTQRVEVMVNRPPVAVVDEAIQSCTDQVIIFSSARSFDPDGDSFTAMWDFGDGTTSLEANPVKSYTAPGIYRARLTLDDGFAETPVIQEIPIVIEGSPQARIAEMPLTVCANSPVVFDGAGSTDPSGMIGSFSWDFGDMNTAVGERTTHLFTRPGTYRVTLTITGSGTGNCPNISQATVLMTVVAAPRARFELPSVVAPGQTVVLDGSASETSDRITDARWEVRREGQVYASFAGLENRFTPAEPGRYEVSLTISTDNDAGCSRNTETRVLQVNAAPEMVWNLPEQWPMNTPFRLSAAGTADSDGFVASMVWLVDGEEVGNGLTAELPVDRYGSRRVELVVRDNAGVSNSEVRRAGEVLVNPAPEPRFVLPERVFEGEVVRLEAVARTDAAGNAVRSWWRVNGAEAGGRAASDGSGSGSGSGAGVATGAGSGGSGSGSGARSCHRCRIGWFWFGLGCRSCHRCRIGWFGFGLGCRSCHRCRIGGIGCYYWRRFWFCIGRLAGFGVCGGRTAVRY